MIAMCCSTAVRVASFVKFARRTRGTHVCVAAVMAFATAASAEPVCDAHLSAAQRARFALTLSACAVESAPGSAQAAPHADALVASAQRPSAALQARTSGPASASATPTTPAAAAPESAHLQLFGKPGLAMARMTGAGDAGLAGAVRRPASELQGMGGPAKTGKVGKAGTHGATASAARLISRAEALAPQVDAVARRYDIDPLLLHAIAHVESRHNPAARSPAGALGVMQVMPATGARFGVAQPEALQQPGTNLEVSAAYLKTLQQRFGNNLSLVLAAYNAGEGAVERHGRHVPPYAETQSYVRQVLDRYRVLSQTAVATDVTAGRHRVVASAF